MCLLGRGSLCGQPSVKTVDVESLLIALVDSIPQVMSKLVPGLGVGESTGSGSLEACAKFPANFFLIFALYPFPVLHHSCENDRCGVL